MDVMNVLQNWNYLSSGTYPVVDGKPIGTNVPGALLDLLENLGKLAENLAKLIGLVA